MENLQKIMNIKPHKNTCPECNSIEHSELRHYDPIWQDGEVWCKQCNVFVRHYDAGI